MSYNYGSLQDYLKFRQLHCKPISSDLIRSGSMVSLSYIWAEGEYEKGGKPVPKSFFNAWSFFPLIQVGPTRMTAEQSGKRFFRAVNYQFLSVPERIELYRGGNISESRLQEAVRNYRYEGVKLAFYVPKKVQEEILLFYPSGVYFKSTYPKVTGQSVQRARSFVKHYWET